MFSLTGDSGIVYQVDDAPFNAQDGRARLYTGRDNTGRDKVIKLYPAPITDQRATGSLKTAAPRRFATGRYGTHRRACPSNWMCGCAAGSPARSAIRTPPMPGPRVPDGATNPAARSSMRTAATGWTPSAYSTGTVSPAAMAARPFSEE